MTSTGSKCTNKKDPENGLCFGGVARLKYMVDETKRNNENTIFLNAGDFFQVFSLSLRSFHSKICVKIYNTILFNAVDFFQVFLLRLRIFYSKICVKIYNSIFLSEGDFF